MPAGPRAARQRLATQRPQSSTSGAGHQAEGPRKAGPGATVFSWRVARVWFSLGFRAVDGAISVGIQHGEIAVGIGVDFLERDEPVAVGVDGVELGRIAGAGDFRAAEPAVAIVVVEQDQLGDEAIVFGAIDLAVIVGVGRIEPVGRRSGGDLGRNRRGAREAQQQGQCDGR